MRTIRFGKANHSDNLLHIETDFGIVNIRVGLHDAEGRAVTSVEIIPDNYGGEPAITLDGYRNNRLIQAS